MGDGEGERERERRRTPEERHNTNDEYPQVMRYERKVDDLCRDEHAPTRRVSIHSPHSTGGESRDGEGGRTSYV